MTRLNEYLNQSEAMQRRNLTANAILARAGLIPRDPDNVYGSESLSELAAAAAERAGASTIGRTGAENVAQAFMHSSSDFPALLLDVAQRAALKGYDAAGETFQHWTSKGGLQDFRAGTRTGIGTFPTLDEVPENGEYRYALIDDRGESVQLGTYGKLFHVTRAATLADDLGELTRIPLRAGRAAARTVGDLAYSVLTTNSNLADGVPLFHADHNNLLSAAAISVASVAAMAAAMSTQTSNGVRTGARLRYLIVPVALEGLARYITGATFPLAAPAFEFPPNGVYGTVDVIADSRLDDDSATAWYGAADPAAFDTVEVSYLGGNDKPTVEQHQRFTTDGTAFKVRIDAGAKALDWRCLAKNPGA